MKRVTTKAQRFDAAEEYSAGIDQVAKAIMIVYGERCETFDNGCLTCMMWAQFDAFNETVGKAVCHDDD